MEQNITKEWLRQHPNCIFVFGDNTQRFGQGGAAKLRYEPNVYGFITKKYPNHTNDAYYKPTEYMSVFESELEKLISEIESNPGKTYLISRLGGGLANKFGIFEKVILPNIKVLNVYENVRFLFCW